MNDEQPNQPLDVTDEQDAAGSVDGNGTTGTSASIGDETAEVTNSAAGETNGQAEAPDADAGMAQQQEGGVDAADAALQADALASQPDDAGSFSIDAGDATPADETPSPGDDAAVGEDAAAATADFSDQPEAGDADEALPVADAAAESDELTAGAIDATGESAGAESPTLSEDDVPGDAVAAAGGAGGAGDEGARDAGRRGPQGPQGPQGFQGQAEEEPMPEMVIRTARDPRLDEMAPNASMEDLLRASEQQYSTLKHGEVIEGSVMKVGREEILVDIGAKTEGIIPNHELQSLSEEERAALKPGDMLLVSVLQPENSDGHAVLSLDRARQEKSWRDLQKQFEAGEIIQAKVTGHNKGGLLVNLEGVRGFVPSSQISSMPAGEANKQAELARLQNSTMPLKIIEINRGRNRLILSERQAMQEQREGMRTRLLQELEPGQVRPGTVTSICDFGAFVDIGGADGLIHLSELSWRRVSHPSEVLKVGERIDVHVLSVDPNERKIALSLKRTQPEPWTTITENYQLGQLVRGTITQLTSFGAFARLEDGIEGLIHVSELAEGRVAHPRSVVNVGDQVELKVIRIDPAKRRIGLSLKRVNEDAEGGEGGGASGVMDEDDTQQYGGPVSDAPDQEASVEQREQAAPSRTERFEQRFERGDRPERPERQDRDRGRGGSQRRGREAAQPAFGGYSSGQDDQPMGALAAALAGYSRGAEEAVETDEDTGVEDVSTGAQPEAMMPSAADTSEALTDEDSGATDIPDTAGDVETAGDSLEGGVEDIAPTGTDDTGASSDVEQATVGEDSPTGGADETAGAGESLSDVADIDSGAASGSEALPSVADSDVEGGTEGDSSTIVETTDWSDSSATRGEDAAAGPETEATDGEDVTATADDLPGADTVVDTTDWSDSSATKGEDAAAGPDTES